MLIAQISDCHVTAPGVGVMGRIDTNRFLTLAVAHLNALRPRPDLALITGDLVNDGLPEQYRAAAELLAPLEIPLRVTPGNHDDRDLMRATFGAAGYLPTTGDFLHFVEDSFPLRLLCLDTLVPGRSGGELCQRRLDWLEQRLAEGGERPTIIAMHHPPFDTGILHMDRIKCASDVALGDIVQSYPNIQAVICGHVHRAVFTRWRGAAATICPGSAHQVPLDLVPSSQPAYSMEPPAVALHHWRAGRGLVSHLSFIGDYPSQPFNEG